MYSLRMIECVLGDVICLCVARYSYRPRWILYRRTLPRLLPLAYPFCRKSFRRRNRLCIERSLLRFPSTLVNYFVLIVVASVRTIPGCLLRRGVFCSISVPSNRTVPSSYRPGLAVRHIPEYNERRKTKTKKKPTDLFVPNSNVQ